jgi:hypothetical protein
MDHVDTRKEGSKKHLGDRSSPRCSPSLGKYFMHFLICVLEFLAYKFQKQPGKIFSSMVL